MSNIILATGGGNVILPKNRKINEAKSEVARQISNDRKWQFKLLTEDHLVR